MKRIYDFSRSPSARNYTVSDLKALKGSDKKLSMSNPANADELRACMDAGIDLLERTPLTLYRLDIRMLRSSFWRFAV